MREQRETFDLIERYLQGGLSAEERALVDDKIMNNPSFAAEVRLSEQVNSVVAGANLDMLREKMTNDLAQLDRGNKTKWWTGGALALLISTGVAYVSLKEDNTSEITNLKNNNKEQTFKESISIQEDGPVVSSQAKKFIPSSPDEQKEVQPDTFKNNVIGDLAIKQETHQNAQVLENISKDPVQNKEDNKDHPMNCKVSFHAIAHPTCKGELKGKVDVDMESITGGTSPYVFSMNHTESSSGIFSDLGEGKHIITIRDKSGCSASREVMVTGKNCSEKKSFSINPDNGEAVKIHFSDGESGNFSIINRTGIAIFRGSFGNGELNEWNGTKMSGETAETGMYVCILEYSSGKKETIQITVIR